MRIRRTRYTIFFLSIFLLAALLYGYRHLHQARENKNLANVTIAQAADTLLYLPLYVAADEGYLRENGIDLNIVTAGGDSQAFAALASGQAQFAQGDPTFVAISHSRGGPGIVIASVLDRVAFWGVTFDKNLQPFTDPKNFRGMNVVTFPSPNTAYVVQERLVQEAGLDLGKDTQITQVAFGSELGPIRNGTAQIAVSIEPTVSNAVQQGAHVVYSYADEWGPFALTGLMTTEQFAKSNSHVVQGMVNSYERALQLIRTNPQLALVVAKHHYPGVSDQVLQAALARLVSQDVFPQHATMSQASWDAAIKLREEVGDLESGNYESLNVQQYGMEALRSSK